MLKRLFFGIAALALAGAVFGQAYKWVDEDGVVHYSDRPQEGAEEIQLPTTQRSSQPSRSPTPATRQTTQAAEPAEETLWNIESVLNVTLNATPALQRGHRVRVYFDGTPQMVSGTSFQIEEVYRGVHNLQAEILDETGKMMIRSIPNRFYVQQNTIAR